jgi:hypothetical protein
MIEDEYGVDSGFVAISGLLTAGSPSTEQISRVKANLRRKVPKHIKLLKQVS